MPHGLVHESEEKLRAHFFYTGTPSATGLVGLFCDRRHRKCNDSILNAALHFETDRLYDPRATLSMRFSTA